MVAKGKTSHFGFSLVELLTVIAIIGVLTAIMRPRVQQFVIKSRKAEAITNLRGIYATQLAFNSAETIYTTCSHCPPFFNGDMTQWDPDGTHVIYSQPGGGCNLTGGAHDEFGFKITDCRKARFFYFGDTDEGVYPTFWFNSPYRMALGRAIERGLDGPNRKVFTCGSSDPNVGTFDSRSYDHWQVDANGVVTNPQPGKC